MNWEDLPLRRSLTARGSKEGFVYVIEFSFGVVKIGQTTTPRGRMRQHDADAKKFGGWITRWWMSHSHEDWHQNEALLMGECLRIGRQTNGEYFADCDYDAVVDFAERLDGNTSSRVSFQSIAGITDGTGFDDWARSNGVLRRVALR